MLDLLRRYQREGVTPSFPAFLAQVKKTFDLKMQAGPLSQRLRLLESVVAESPENAALVSQHGGCDLISCIQPGVLVVADMTDPLLSSGERKVCSRRGCSVRKLLPK